MDFVTHYIDRFAIVFLNHFKHVRPSVPLISFRAFFLSNSRLQRLSYIHEIRYTDVLSGRSMHANEKSIGSNQFYEHSSYNVCSVV